MSEVAIRHATNVDKPEWLRMRLLLWPDGTPEGFAKEMEELLADPLTTVFVAVCPNASLAVSSKRVRANMLRAVRPTRSGTSKAGMWTKACACRALARRW
jgi:hypothetical protein